jgi:hypothetical protein
MHPEDKIYSATSQCGHLLDGRRSHQISGEDHRVPERLHVTVNLQMLV